MSPEDSRLTARLRASAHHLAGLGRHDQARDCFRQLLDLEPQDLESLNFLAMDLLARGAAEQSLALLRQAQRADPGDVPTRKNLGVALLAASRLDAAHDVLQALVSELPEFVVARLHLAHALERKGATREALLHYFKAISGAQRAGSWLDDASTPPGLRSAVRHGMRYLRAGRRQVLDAIMAPLRARHGASAMRRMDACLSGYLGDTVVEQAPGQHAGFLYFPGLAPSHYFDRQQFDWYETLESAYPAIRAELEALLAAGTGLQPFLGAPHRHGDSYLGPASPDAAPPRWDGLFFHRHGAANAQARALCPATAAALDATPLVRIPGHAPEALFSVLGPESHIRPHTGVTNTRVVTHLPIVVPADCALRVHGEDHCWREGRCITFDDTFLHEAWNRSDRTRVVLLFDTWHPGLTPEEREAVTGLVVGIGELNGETLLAG